MLVKAISVTNKDGFKLKEELNKKVLKTFEEVFSKKNVNLLNSDCDKFTCFVISSPEIHFMLFGTVVRLLCIFYCKYLLAIQYANDLC